MFYNDDNPNDYLRHRPRYLPGPAEQLRNIRTVERLVVAVSVFVCACLLLAGVTSWREGGGVTMMLIALLVTAVSVLALPRIQHMAYKHIVAADEDLDDEWRRISNP
jgi:archaellum biogenesis protein FlaJ (TadC family)